MAKVPKANPGARKPDEQAIATADLQKLLQNASMTLATSEHNRGGGGDGVGRINFAAKAMDGDLWTINGRSFNPDTYGPFLVDFMSIAKGFIAWADRKPLTFFSPIVSGKVLRQEDMRLDMHPTHSHAEVFEAWQFNGRFLTSPKPFRFETNSGGGARAVMDFVDTARAACLAFGQVAHPALVLGAESYEHRQYGAINVPTFEVVGYVLNSMVDKKGDAVSASDIVHAPAPPQTANGNSRTGKRGGAF